MERRLPPAAGEGESILLAAQPAMTSIGTQSWDEGAAALPQMTTSPVERAFSALRRYRFLVVGIVLLAGAVGVAETRFVKPMYEARATIWIESDTPLDKQSGPIRPAELLNADAWVELLKSYRITEAVVRKLVLYVHPANPLDAPIFRTFATGNRFVPGTYRLLLHRNEGRWTLLSARLVPLDSGTSRDSVGARLGLRWTLPPEAFVGQGDRTVDFYLGTPRETAIVLRDRLNTRLEPQSNFIWLTLQDRDPALAARTLNTWSKEFVTVASDLKRRNVVELANILRDQLNSADSTLQNAESALEQFSARTITLPKDGVGNAASTNSATRDPALAAFFQQKLEYDNLRLDRQNLERVVNDAKRGAVPWESVLLIPSVSQSPGAEALRTAFNTQYDEQARLSAARQIYTDQYPAVKQLMASLNTLQTVTIPQLAEQLVIELAQREAAYDTRVVSQSRDLREIPSRTLEQMRLQRAVGVAEALYTTLQTRYAEAQLAEASTVADVSVLDTAIAPLWPSKNTKSYVMLFAVVVGIGGAIGLALLLDRVDRRLQYPEQASTELALPIAGAVPRLPKRGIDRRSPEQVYQLVESFRSLRMTVASASGVPVSLAISSPCPADGKSFVAANLAMSFAEGGFRTILVDGDTRRGTLHDTFSLARTPGLTDLLAGVAERVAVIHATPHQNLWVLPSGTRRRQSPEYLAAPQLRDLIQTLRGEFDVVICDTPPLSVGVDAYAVSAAAERLLVVLRVGKTQRKMAAAKLAPLDRLPVEIIGAVLNAVRSNGAFQYHAYVSGYEPLDEEFAALPRG